MITKEGFNKTMNALLNFFPKEAPKKEAHELYFLIFNKNFASDEDLQQATLSVVETRVFPSFPKPAEFMEACRKKIDIESKVVKASLEIKEAIKKYGAYSNVCFDDPVIHACIRDLFGGWVKACKCSLEEFESLLKWELPKLYKYNSQNKIKNLPIFLEGVTSHENGNKGIAHKIEIEYIGNKEKCIQWTESYFKKNPNELINKEKYISLGYAEPNTRLLELEKEFVPSMTKEELFSKYISYEKKDVLDCREKSKEEVLRMIKAN